MNDKKFGIGVGVMIMRDGKVLLGHRHEDSEKADSLLQGEGTWTFPGGKLDIGEKLGDCVCREAYEETSLKMDKKNLKVISVSDEFSDLAQFTTIGFMCEDFEGEARVMEPDEITQWKWFTLDSLPSPIYKPTQAMIDNYLNKVIYSN